MHGPLPPDVTLDAPHWWLPGMPLLPPADYMAPVPLKRKRDTSAEPKRDPTKRAYTRTPDEAKLGFQDFHANQARVHGAGRSIWCRSSSGPRRPTHSADGTTAAHVTVVADRPWSYHHSPSLMPSRPGSASASPLGSTSTAVCCASSTSNSSPADDGRGSFCSACSSHGNSQRLARATCRARLTLLDSVNFCSCASSTCAIDSKSHRSHLEPGRDSCAHRSGRRGRVEQDGRGSPRLRLARLGHGHARCEHEGRHVDRLSVRGKAAEYTLMDQRSRASSCPTPRRTGSRRRHSWT